MMQFLDSLGHEGRWTIQMTFNGLMFLAVLFLALRRG